ncbi:MAG: hypothetical protein NT062_13215 [Proteobacteria bacterium]|nr:hypothetical protein [Pseudomonadota bacterium]
MKPGTDPSTVHCSTSAALPSLDAIGGAAAIAASAGGTLYEGVSDNADFKNFKYYYALPLLAVGIAYMWSASYGTDHVEACTEYKEKAGQPSLWQIQPIEGPPAKDDERPPTR